MFKFEDCLLKHYIRVSGWLPLCKKRLQSIRLIKYKKDSRRLKYFTFCAVGAIDVLMLDVERIIRRSNDKRFDTVFFFDTDPDNVTETQKRIPGAIGFPANFVDIALQLGTAVYPAAGQIYLGSTGSDTLENRKLERHRLIVNQFKKHFPFDVINLDLEEFIFKPNDPYPGNVINALRNTFACQTQPLIIGGKSQYIEGFTLMFTTQIGPSNLPTEYLNMLESKISDNLRAYPELIEILNSKAGTQEVHLLRDSNFDLFFKLAVPKVIAAALHAEDWFIDPEQGIKIFEFERPHRSGTYMLLHLAMDVKRQKPPRGARAPLETCPEAIAAYKSVCIKLFREDPVIVSDASINKEKLQAHLDKIKARRRKYFLDER